jgi:hypothetical protein
MSIRIGIGIDNFASGGIDADATTIYNRIIADGGVSNLTRLNFFVKGLKTIYGSLTNVPVCYDAHWIGYKLGSGTGATAGQAAAKLYSLTVAGDAVQTTAASQPLLLSHSGASYFFCPQVANNYCTTSNKVASFAGDFEYECQITSRSVDSTSYPSVSSSTNYSMGIFFYARAIGFWYNGNDVRTTALLPTGTFNGYIKVVRTGSTWDFYTSTNGSTWTLFESKTDTTTTINTTGTFQVGTTDFSTYNYNGNIYRVRIWRNGNRTTGTLTYDFNPATYNASTSQTDWTSATGEVWTINTGTATTGYKGVLVDRTIVMADGVDDKMSSTYNRPDTLTQYSAFKINNSTKTGCLFGQNSSNGNTNNVFIDSAVYYYLNAGSSNVNRPLVNNSLQTVTTVSNAGVENSIRLNNGTASTNAYTPTPSGNGVSIFARATDSFLTANINTYIVVANADDSTNRTATYNLIRSLNNNAF